MGRTERELALALEHEMRVLGAEDPSFDTIIAAGSHGALPHASRGMVAVARGDLVVIDWGARLDGYCSDCTRTVAAGEPGEQARAAYELVLAAQLAGAGAVRAGAAAARRRRDRACGDRRRWSKASASATVSDMASGLRSTRSPASSQRSEDTLAAGNVVTVEPGVYLPGRFGVRIEDLLVVTDEGSRTLTLSEGTDPLRLNAILRPDGSSGHTVRDPRRSRLALSSLGPAGDRAALRNHFELQLPSLCRPTKSTCQ